MLGAVATLQVITAEFCTGVPVQMSWPVAATVVVTEQSVARNGETCRVRSGRAGRQGGGREHLGVGHGPITDHDNVR